MLAKLENTKDARRINSINLIKSLKERASLKEFINIPAAVVPNSKKAINIRDDKDITRSFDIYIFALLCPYTMVLFIVPLENSSSTRLTTINIRIIHIQGENPKDE